MVGTDLWKQHASYRLAFAARRSGRRCQGVEKTAVDRQRADVRNFHLRPRLHPAGPDLVGGAALRPGELRLLNRRKFPRQLSPRIVAARPNGPSQRIFLGVRLRGGPAAADPHGGGDARFET